MGGHPARGPRVRGGLGPAGLAAPTLRAVRSLKAAIGAAALLALAPAPAGAATCEWAGSRTVLSTSNARVYYTPGGQPFSCYRITGRRIALDLFTDRNYAPRDARLGLLRIAGRVLAYTWIDPGVPVVHVHSVDMRLARFHHRAVVRPVVSAQPSAVRVTDLVVRAGGAIAWVQEVEGEVSVWRFDARGRRRLDAGPGIDRASLRLMSGGRLTWLRDGSSRIAALR